MTFCNSQNCIILQVFHLQRGVRNFSIVTAFRKFTCSQQTNSLNFAKGKNPALPLKSVLDPKLKSILAFEPFKQSSLMGMI